LKNEVGCRSNPSSRRGNGLDLLLFVAAFFMGVVVLIGCWVAGSPLGVYSPAEPRMNQIRRLHNG
jgi:hypothetical protein